MVDPGSRAAALDAIATGTAIAAAVTAAAASTPFESVDTDAPSPLELPADLDSRAAELSEFDSVDKNVASGIVRAGSRRDCSASPRSCDSASSRGSFNVNHTAAANTKPGIAVHRRTVRQLDSDVRASPDSMSRPRLWPLLLFAKDAAVCCAARVASLRWRAARTAQKERARPT